MSEESRPADAAASTAPSDDEIEVVEQPSLLKKARIHSKLITTEADMIEDRKAKFVAWTSRYRWIESGPKHEEAYIKDCVITCKLCSTVCCKLLVVHPNQSGALGTHMSSKRYCFPNTFVLFWFYIINICLIT